jgi:hypothetical protein
MKRIRGSYFRQRPFLGNVVATLQRAGWIAALVILAALPSHAYSWYSGVSVGSTGTIYGWGVTDITSYTMVHQAYVATKLTSPKGRQASHSEGNAPNYYREDVQLPFDATDMGTYTETSTNQGWCFACLCWVVNTVTAAQLYVPIPYAIAVLNTLVQGPAQCPAGMAGWSRTVTAQLQDQLGVPVLVSGITMADQIFIGSPNDLNIAGSYTGGTTTDSSGTWPDLYFVCSPNCPSNGQSDGLQSWTWDGIPLPHANTLIYKCGGITIDGR